MAYIFSVFWRQLRSRIARNLERMYMIQKFFSILVILLPLFYWSCESNESPRDAPRTDSSTVSGREMMDQLRAQALEESDIAGRLQATVTVMQEAFSRSEAAMPALQNVRVSIDGDCLLTIGNYPEPGAETRVSLHDLDPDGFQLIPDQQEGEFPGLRIRTLDGRSVVEVKKKGGVLQQKSELEIFMADREAIGRVTPYMVQALNICRGVTYSD
jgi:hypothetical protein